MIAPPNKSRGGSPDGSRDNQRGGPRAASGVRRTGARSPGRGVWVSCALLLLVAAVGCAWWLSRRGADAPGEDVGERVRRRGEPARRTAPPPRVEEPAPEKPPKPQRVGEVRDGKVMLLDGSLRTVSKHVVTSTVARISVADRTFERETDRMLAHILEIEPGESLIGDSDLLYEGFDKEFVKSLEFPIEYDKDDDRYVKELKIGVTALRQELRELMEAGEDINAVLAETRNQMQELGLYRQDLEDEVVRLTQDHDLTQEDYDEIIRAANTMLAERGSKPLDLPVAVKHRLRIRNAKELEKQQEEQK